MSCDMKWLAADIGPGCSCSPVWNTAVRDKTFLGSLLSLTSVARTPETKRIVAVAVVVGERDLAITLVHI